MADMAENMYQFDLPLHHKSIIKVVGVGGGGSNAVNHMHSLGIRDVEFVVCNTDIQALEISSVPNKLQLGINLTKGLGVGSDPKKGKDAALESKEEIRDFLSQDTKMVFITAGMGGGTGTGAAPVIAQVAKELGILTVGIVTAPFAFEGKKKAQKAEEGIRELKQHCDTVLVIMNEKLKEIYGDMTLTEGFAQADNVLTTAAKGIAVIITVPGLVNVDFEDVKTVMKNAGPAVMGSAKTLGENRGRRAVEEALISPLLNQQNIYGAEKILLSIMSGEEEILVDELKDITNYIEEYANDAEVIFGHSVDSALGEHIQVTIIATGFGKMNEQGEYVNKNDNTKVFDLESNQISLFDERNKTKEDFAFEYGEPESEQEEEEETKSYDVGWLKRKVEREIEEEDKKEREENELEFELQNEHQAEQIHEEEIETEDTFVEISDFKKHQLVEQRAIREATFEGKKFEMADGEFNERLEVPAYERKKVSLQNVPHSSEKNISKFNLTDENKIMGNNKFLHDNVD